MRTRTDTPRPRRTSAGFSLVELMITLVVFSLVAGAIVTVLVVSSIQSSSTSNETTATEQARAAIDMMARDLRCAGFNTDLTASSPQPPIAYVDSLQILINADLTPYPDTSVTKRGIPLAYNPNGSPRPKPLIGTSWTPVQRYTTGAELIRWTLDLNNNGTLTSADLNVADGADAKHTANPYDYELCREVYGDSTGGVQTNNGGTRERIAVIKEPCGTQPPLFRVYLSGSNTPWDWSSGPVPANRLAEIVRVEINVVATAATRNFFGGYSDTRLSTTVSEIRNAPNYSGARYNISGIAFNDANGNKVKDAGEAYVSGAQMVIGSNLSQVTSSTGAYSFDVPPGTYTVREIPPPNFTVTPDSAVVTVGPNVVQNFPNTARSGGYVNLLVYNDSDKNKSYGGSDVPLGGVTVQLDGTGVIDVTDASGLASIFCPVGQYSITAVLPDSFVSSTQNPLKGSMTNGATISGKIGMYIYDAGTVSGTVFSDVNGNNAIDSGEKGVPSASISVTLPDSTYLYTSSDNNGKYSLKLPVNDPPKTTPYTVVCTPPPGFNAGQKMMVTGVYLQLNQQLQNQNFGLGKFSVSKFNVNDPIRALAVGDFIENDWLGTNTAYRRNDKDLVTGSANGTASRLAQWFNQYNAASLFNNAPNGSMPSGQSIYSLAVDTLNAGANGMARPDVIVGMRYAASGNWGVWYTRETSGNEGYLPSSITSTYTTSDNGDVTAVVTYPPAAGGTPMVIVGTNGPTSGTGVIEAWTAATHTAAPPTFIRAQTMPPGGGIPANTMGSVLDLQVDEIVSAYSGQELLVGTQTGYYSGQVMLFKCVSNSWTYVWGVTLASDAVTALTTADIDGDGKLDIVVGTQNGHSSGRMLYYRNTSGSSASFAAAVAVNAPGIVTALARADFNGDNHHDLVVGFRDTDTTYGGGIQIWYVTTTMPTSGIDPSAGQVTNWVTSIYVGNVNYGTYPVVPSGAVAPDILGAAQSSSTNSYVFTMLR